ncbi:MAG: OmpA family protein [Bacteroidota bacterium]
MKYTKYSKILISFIFIIFFYAVSFAQVTNISANKLSLRQLQKFGAEALRMGDPYKAIVFYERYCELDPTDYDMMLKLAKIYQRTRNYNQAEKYFKKVYAKSPEKHTEALYGYAQILKNKGKYELAIEKLKKFEDEYRGYKYSRRNLLEEIKMLNNVIEQIQNPLNVEIFHLDTSINRAHIDFNPLLLNDNKLIYGSLRADTLPTIQTEQGEKIQKRPVRKFYQAKRTGENEWTFDGEFNEQFNYPNANTGNGSFSPDGKEFYFAKCQPNWNNKMICHIYVSKKENNGWSSPEKLGAPVNIENHSSTQPTVGYITKYRRKHKILYFVSDRPVRSQGGWDIWFSIFDTRDSIYKRVDNVGGRYINTEGNEISPYYDQNSRTLYYSSDHKSPYGGYDIYKIRGSGRRWKNKEYLKYPVNTGADESYYSINKWKREEAFFASNRDGTVELLHPNCCDDIFSVFYKDFINIALTGQIFEVPPSANYIKKDTSQKTPLNNALAEVYYWDETDSSMTFLYSDTTNENGDYFVPLDPNETYRVLLKKDGYFYEMASLNTKEMERSDTLHKDAFLFKIPDEPIVYNIYYEFDSSSLTEQAKNKIDTTIYKILHETPDIIVELSSHTDSKGSDEYNEKLSQRRAQSVVDYLQNKGIDKKRLRAKGYGESKPIATNETEEGRAKNRRTEFEVIGSTNPYSKLNISKMKIIKKNPKGEEIREKSKNR